jgi:cytochrome c556
MKYVLRTTVYFFALLLLAGFPSLLCYAHDEGHVVHGSAEHPATNPLIEEMLTLDNAFRDIISAVALNDTAKVQAALQSMSGAMEKTHAGMHTGTVTLPKNASRSKEFIEKDKRFHEKLEALDRAARRDNQREMLRITKQLLDGCVQCHQTFRK